jgi:hypothetical protein
MIDTGPFRNSQHIEQEMAAIGKKLGDICGYCRHTIEPSERNGLTARMRRCATPRGESEHKLLDTFFRLPRLHCRSRAEATHCSHWLAHGPRSLIDPVDSLIERSIDVCGANVRESKNHVI